MSDEDTKNGEIIPPGVPARRSSGNVPTTRLVDDMPTDNPTSVVGAAVTRFFAGLRRKANDSLAADANSRANYFDAVGRAAKSFIGMRQAASEVGELDDILALDKKERAGEREERASEVEHRKAVAERRRKQELTEAKRGAFNAEQGYKNQQRLKQLNLEIWKKRKEVEHLDAETIAARLRGEADPNAKKRGKGLLSELQTLAKNLQQTISEAEADGQDTDGNRIALKELEEFIERLRGR
jgi:hypothetical protein